MSDAVLVLNVKYPSRVNTNISYG